MPMSNEAKPERSEKIIVHLSSDIGDIVPIFLAHRAHDVEAIFQALERNDFKIIQTLGHKMRGTGGGYGFDGISEIGARLEQAAIETNSLEISGQVVELAYYLKHLEIVWHDEELE